MTLNLCWARARTAIPPPTTSRLIPRRRSCRPSASRGLTQTTAFRGRAGAPVRRGLRARRADGGTVCRAGLLRARRQLRLEALFRRKAPIRFSEAGFYAVTLTAALPELAVERSFFVTVLDGEGNPPAEDFNTYFDFEWDENAYEGLYFARESPEKWPWARCIEWRPAATGGTNRRELHLPQRRGLCRAEPVDYDGTTCNTCRCCPRRAGKRAGANTG
jgi:hypothetical protein